MKEVIIKMLNEATNEQMKIIYQFILNLLKWNPGIRKHPIVKKHLGVF